jgi:hypothetical protein
LRKALEPHSQLCAQVVTEMQFRQHIQRWLRCVLRAALESVEGSWIEAGEWWENGHGKPPFLRGNSTGVF